MYFEDGSASRPTPDGAERTQLSLPVPRVGKGLVAWAWTSFPSPRTDPAVPQTSPASEALLRGCTLRPKDLDGSCCSAETL